MPISHDSRNDLSTFPMRYDHLKALFKSWKTCYSQHDEYNWDSFLELLKDASWVARIIEPAELNRELLEISAMAAELETLSGLKKTADILVECAEFMYENDTWAGPGIEKPATMEEFRWLILRSRDIMDADDGSKEMSVFREGFWPFGEDSFEKKWRWVHGLWDSHEKGALAMSYLEVLDDINFQQQFCTTAYLQDQTANLSRLVALLSINPQTYNINPQTYTQKLRDSKELKEFLRCCAIHLWDENPIWPTVGDISKEIRRPNRIEELKTIFRSPGVWD